MAAIKSKKTEKKPTKTVKAPTVASTKQTPLTKSGFWSTWAKVISSPREFFEKLPKEVKYKEPSVFYLKLYALMLGIMIVFFLALFAMFFPMLGPLTPLIGGAGIAVGLIMLIILFPLALFLSWGFLFVGAGITHLLVMLFGGKEGYHETFKANAYATAPSLFFIIPYVGWLAVIYSIIVLIIGIHKRQNISLGRSAAAVLLPIVIILVLVFLIFALLFAPLMMI